MELINRYVYQVGRRLPERTRADVEQELRSLLLDALEERTGRAADFTEEEQVAVLEEFGPPEQMADKYRPQARYVIGPKLYDLYRLVVTVIAGAGLLAAIVLTVVTALGPDAPSALNLLLQAWTTFINILLSGIGSATLIFAVLERVIPEEEFKLDEGKKWNPHDLPAIEPRDEIKRGGLIAEIAFTALVIAALAAFGDRIGGVYYDGTWHTTPSFLSAAFFSLYLPLFIVRWGLTIGLDVVLLRQGRWQLGTRIAALLFQGFDIYILGRLLNGPAVVNPEALRVGLAAAPEGAEALIGLLNNGLRLGFLIALIVVVLDAVYKVYRLIRDYQLWVTIKPKRAA
ncbi:MAG TPA: hypothetical protein PKZ84_00825 [Anaerolineae bacterium]|nr:hypothetical protein [Anaerolineae bacterium]HQI82942.1 hypothetical protein [Anaerolineae bacterium]